MFPFILIFDYDDALGGGERIVGFKVGSQVIIEVVHFCPRTDIDIAGLEWEYMERVWEDLVVKQDLAFPISWRMNR